MNKVILKIEGMSCSACKETLEKYLNKQKGINSALVNLVLAEAVIEYDDSLTIDDLNRFVSEAGYKSLGELNKNKENKKDHTLIYLIILALLILLLMYVSMGHMVGIPSIPFLDMMDHPINYGLSLFILTIPFLVFGYDIISRGLKNLIKRHPNMDSLVSIGVLTSLVYSLINLILIICGKEYLKEFLYFESCAMIIYFIKLGRFIDKNSKDKTKEAIQELVQITPDYAYLKEKDGSKKVTIDEVKKGDILICKPGMKVAVDGNIVKGNAHFDESFITGESKSKRKEKGERVIAGSINLDGYIEYKADKIGVNSTISEIVRLVTSAASSKTKINKLTDKVCEYFVPTIIGIALLTFIIHLIIGTHFNDAFIYGVSVLVVACPCALGLATPLSLVASVGKCAKKGILIKSGEILENTNKVDTVVFDKTGTLTYGDLRLFKVFNYTSEEDNAILTKCASLERFSTHPISNAFKKYAKDNKLSNLMVDDFKNIEGVGIKGKIKDEEIYLGNKNILKELQIKNTHLKDEEELTSNGCSIIYVVIDKKIVSLIGVNDIIRSEAQKVIAKLKKMNKGVVLLSGDNLEVAKIIGEKLGIDHIVAEVMPKEKAEYLEKLSKEGKKVLMVGDGINDAPSLASSLVGVSISEGTDVARDSADVILLNSDLTRIITLLRVSKETMKIIKQNLFWAFFYNVCMIPIAMGIFANFNVVIKPMFASLAMVLSSLTVVFNSLRLRN